MNHLLSTYILSNLLIGIGMLSAGTAIAVGCWKNRRNHYFWIRFTFSVFFIAASIGRIIKAFDGPAEAFSAAELAVDVLAASVSMAIAIWIWPIVLKTLNQPSYGELESSNEQLRLAIEDANIARGIFRSFMDNLPTMALMRDVAGHVRLVNKAWEQATTQDRDTHLGKKAMSWLPENMAAAELAKDRQVLETGEKLEEIVNLPLPDGTERTWLMIRFPVTGPAEEKLIGIIAVDLSAQREAEKQIADLNKELTSKLEDLSATNQALQIARDQALEASNLKSAFVANISHEIRTPLAGILGLNELVLEQPDLSEDSKHMASMVQDSAIGLLAVVNDILDLAKIEAGKMTLEYEWFDVRNMALECMNIIRSNAQSKNMHLTLEIDANIPQKLYGDPSRIRQVLLNLLSNGVKFSNDGSVHTEIKQVEESAHSRRIRFSVIDSGAGISPEDRRLLFMPFVQVDNSSTRRHGGTGLGLTISKRFVEAMGGRIGLVSEVGKGSTFWFELAFEKLSTKTNPERLTKPAIEPLAATLSRGRRVLVVEDNSVLQELAVRQLRILGLETKAVSRGKEAIELAMSGQFDIVLMDVNLPDLSGLEATEAIRDMEKSKKVFPIPIIAMTAGAMAGDRERCLASGMDDYVSKPIKIDALKTMLEKWLGRPPGLSKDNSNDSAA